MHYQDGVLNMKDDIIGLIDGFDISQNREISRYSYYKYDDIDKNVVYDAMMWMKQGADIYKSKDNNTSARFSTITFQEIMCLLHFKDAFF